jgi:hypothetical protein
MKVRARRSRAIACSRKLHGEREYAIAVETQRGMCHLPETSTEEPRGGEEAEAERDLPGDEDAAHLPRAHGLRAARLIAQGARGSALPTDSAGPSPNVSPVSSA